MKTRAPYIIAALYAAACAAAVCTGFGSRILSDAAAFPFAQIGSMLRRMSLSGSGGNAAAIIIYVAFCSIPLVAALAKLLRRSFKPRDFLLPLMSLCMFYVVYEMINPSIMTNWGSEFSGIISSVLAWGCWSVIIAWFALSFVANLDGTGSRRYIYILLWLAAGWFITAGFGLNVSELLQNIESVREGNTARADSLGMSCFVLILHYINNALPNVLAAVIALRARELVEKAAGDRFSGATVECASRFGALCAGSLRIIVIVSLIVNLLQIFQIKSLALVSVDVSIPLLEIIFVMASMMLARILREGKQLRDDNDLFI